MSPEVNYYQPSGIDSNSEQGLVTATIGIKEARVPTHRLEFVAPFITTKISRKFSPLYTGNSVGLEDKLIGTPLTEDKSIAAENVANYFALRGSRMLNGMEILYGEDFAARARNLMRAGGKDKLAPASSPQGIEDNKILGILEQNLALMVMEINSNITPEAKAFRAKIYENLYRQAGTKHPDELLQLIKDGRLDFPVLSDLGYPRKDIGLIIDTMEPSKRNAWLFVRDLVKNLSDPSYRNLSSYYSPKSV